MERCCGLVTRSHKPVPLKAISVEVQVKSFVVDVASTLLYKNEEENPVEAVFVFPIEEGCTVYSFEAMVDGKKIVAEIQERQQARDTYDDAISSGEEAFLLEEDESSSDIFTCSIGNLPPNQEAAVSISFVKELLIEADGALRFVLPAVLNPRYTPQDAEKPSVTSHIPYVPKGEIPYNLKLSAQIQHPSGISRVQSNCSLTPLQYLKEDKTSAQVSLSEEQKFDKDVELLIYYNEVNKPSIILEAGVQTASAGTLMGDPIAMLNFYPKFPEKLTQSTCGEFIFLVDRSGSMADSSSNQLEGPTRIDSAKETLLLLLKSLPVGCYFNIYGFGSHFESFFPESVEYTQENMENALEKVKSMDADFGGTEILNPLKDIYSKACRPEQPRQLFVFTDGEVGNTKQVIEEVRKNASSHRCFSFGIGEGASTALIKGIAKAASGTYEFITEDERMQPKALRSLKCALQPTVKGISLNWQLPAGLQAVQLSKTPVAMFKGQRSILYAQLKGKLDEKSKAVATLEYTFMEQVIQNKLVFSLQPEEDSRLTVHHLAAKVMIDDLEDSSQSDSEDEKKKIIELSMQAGVISSHTSFIAVNKDLNQPVQGPLMRRDIPLSRISGVAFGHQPRMMMCYAAAPNIVSFRSVAQSYRLDDDDSEVGCDFLVGAAEIELEEKAPEILPVFKLISLQKVDGSWNLDAKLASVIGLTEQEIKNKMPSKNFDNVLWATILAVIWLHAFGAEYKDEWELLVGKAVVWIKVRAGPSPGDVVKAGNELLKTSVEQQEIGL
ncbi:von Willebrand factor A domain-containing protein 5A isoform X2 [Latimeria chalumnae]|uniref:von Willebrand factor A domain-containing protein 5A isoform X2 n=1 Tax=Latimeria chalumnae TaxID=7897 RepID=UPI0003C161F4|nr:PREDICTED: von Willebrand factor A domain-containing protein 5A-like isoform X2 [Latimeria chalumnae]|eukprot:XP_006001347.1 PREDICTED: von Willebrand factor A domain-containing protein 5A-like isoform X2 [Latimeria chalumnae]